MTTFVKLETLPNKAGEFAVPAERVVMVETIEYVSSGTTYEGTKLHLDNGAEVECAQDIDSVLELLAGELPVVE